MSIAIGWQFLWVAGQFLEWPFFGSRRSNYILTFQSGLCSCQFSDRDAESRATHVIEAHPMTKSDRSGVSTMLAANADLQVLTGFPPPLDAYAHELADAPFIDADERIVRVDALSHVAGKELAGVVARQAEAGLGKVVGAEGEKLGFSRDLAR